MQRLQSHLKQGKTIIQLVRLCDNLELDHHQKMSDFVGRRKKFLSVSEEELKQPPPSEDVSESNENCKLLINFIQVVIDLYDKLDMFWMRYNRARIDCVCLREEKTSIMRENKELKNKLKSYLVTVNMCAGNPIHHQLGEKFSNRPSSMKVERVEHITITSKNEIIKKSKADRRPVTCIEGNLSNAVRHLRITSIMTSTQCYAITNKL